MTDKKKEELSEEELKKASGGHGPLGSSQTGIPAVGVNPAQVTGGKSASPTAGESLETPTLSGGDV